MSIGCYFFMLQLMGLMLQLSDMNMTYAMLVDGCICKAMFSIKHLRENRITESKSKVNKLTYILILFILLFLYRHKIILKYVNFKCFSWIWILDSI